jgi:hypothetical protein
MTPEEMEEVRPRLEAFAAETLGSLARRDQRAKGELYLRGLMLDDTRKSMRPMAGRLGVDHQRLQQDGAAVVADAVESRQREFATLRDRARQALADLGLPPFPHCSPIRAAHRAGHPAWSAAWPTAPATAPPPRPPPRRWRRLMGAELQPGGSRPPDGW